MGRPPRKEAATGKHGDGNRNGYPECGPFTRSEAVMEIL